MQKCRRGWLWKLNCTDQCIVGGSWEMCRKQFRLKTGGSLSFSLFLSSFLSFFLSLLLCFCWHELSVIIDLPSGIIDVFLRSVSIRPRFLHPPIRIKSADMSKLVDEAKKKNKKKKKKNEAKMKRNKSARRNRPEISLISRNALFYFSFFLSIFSLVLNKLIRLEEWARRDLHLTCELLCNPFIEQNSRFLVKWSWKKVEKKEKRRNRGENSWRRRRRRRRVLVEWRIKREKKRERERERESPDRKIAI